MKRVVYTLLYILLSITAYGQGQFNYNKWEEEQQKANTHEKTFNNENLLRKNTAYVNGFIQAGHLHGPGVNIGCFLQNVNIELGYTLGLTESYQILRHNIINETHAYTYRPKAFEAKVGYGVSTLGCLRITPQVGATLIRIEGLQANETNVRNKEDAQTTGFTASVRVDFSFTKYFGLSIVPQYCSKINNDATFDSIIGEENTKDILNWTEGFTCRFGLFMNL